MAGGGKDTRSERAIQRAVLQMCGKLFPRVWITAIPNGAHLAGDKVARFKQMGALKGDGLKVGTPDLLALFDGRGLFIEVKAAKGTLTDTQKALFPILAEHGWPVSIVRNEHDAYTALISAGAPCVGMLS